jgi:hypothetical protein
MKTILGAVVALSLMQAVALAQAPTADAKEGKFYVEGGIGFGVTSMWPDASSNKGFNSAAVFGANFAGEYGITERIAVFTKFGIGLVLEDDPGILNIGMTFDGAYKLIEKKGDVPALTAYAGLGFVNIDVDPKNGKSDDATDFVFETGIQFDISAGESVSIQPFAGFQIVGGSRPFKTYNGLLQVVAGVKGLIKLSDMFYLEPSLSFLGGNFQDTVMFGMGIQVRF